MAFVPSRVVLARDASDDIARVIARLPPSQVEALPTFTSGADAVWHLQHSLVPVFKSGTSQAQIALRFLPDSDGSDVDPRELQEEVVSHWSDLHAEMEEAWEGEGVHVTERLAVRRLPQNIWTLMLYSSLPEHRQSRPVGSAGAGGGPSKRPRGVGVASDVAAGTWATGITSTSISPSFTCLGGMPGPSESGMREVCLQQ